MASGTVKLERSTKTFVFLHLNSTCLPNDNDCRITEICLMAINTSSFTERLEYDLNGRPVLPRVINKIVLCIDPEVVISSEATEKSELIYERLSQQKPFKKYVSLIRSFLKHLEEPVCLIANYGIGFDFLVLKRELKRIGEFNDFASMYCADSLDALRELDPVANIAKKRKADETTKSGLKRSRTEHEQLREKPTTSPLKKAYSLPIELPTQRSFGVREYFEEMFRRKPEDTHTAEGFCKALVNIVHNTPGFMKWVDKNKSKLKNI